MRWTTFCCHLDLQPLTPEIEEWMAEDEEEFGGKMWSTWDSLDEAIADLISTGSFNGTGNSPRAWKYHLEEKFKET